MRLLLLLVWRRRDELESQTGRHPQTRVASVIDQKKTPQHPRPGVGRTRGQFTLGVRRIRRFETGHGCPAPRKEAAYSKLDSSARRLFADGGNISVRRS